MIFGVIVNIRYLYAKFAGTQLHNMNKILNELLSQFEPISLKDMGKVKLMNRIDTKFVTNIHKLIALLPLLKNDYYVQAIDGCSMNGYHTLYYDTRDFSMYTCHHNGRKTRQKVRMREYMDTHDFFLEIKRKNNKGRTKKKRIEIPGFDNFDRQEAAEFLAAKSWFKLDDLIPHLENQFNRITLVNKGGTERLTIDTSLRFHNCVTNLSESVDGLVIIELKQDGNYPSFVRPLLRDLRIAPTGFSKYCIGCAMTNPHLKRNRFKLKLRMVDKLLSEVR